LVILYIVAFSAVGLTQLYTSIQHLFDNIGIRRVELARVWSAIDAAGLVKPAVWNGEAWRLFTGSVLHGSIWHFILNVIALYAPGKVIEVLVGRAYLAIVFFLSALTGSVLSLLLITETSVGSSGGIAGIVSYLAVLGYYNRSSLPPGFLKSMLSTVALVAVFGLVAFALVDNAAHAGGTACGALLGYLLLPHRPAALPLKPGPFVTALGWLCTGGIAASVAGSTIAMVTWR
jgi:membrane associated rhomboid family serine protease